MVDDRKNRKRNPRPFLFVIARYPHGYAAISCAGIRDCFAFARNDAYRYRFSMYIGILDLGGKVQLIGAPVPAVRAPPRPFGSDMAAIFAVV